MAVEPAQERGGTLAFAVAGAAASIVLIRWSAPAVAAPPGLAFAAWASVAAAVVAGLVESIDLRIDDNLSVTFSAAATLWCASLIDAGSVSASWPLVAQRIVPALVVNAIVAAAVMRARQVDAGGALAGAVVGLALALGAGAAGWLMLLAAFVAAAACSKFGERSKRSHGIAEEREDGAARATPWQTAESRPSAPSWRRPRPTPLALLVVVVGLTAGASDTVASEVGKAMRGTTFSVRSLSACPGNPRAMSVAGTVAGAVGAALLAACGAWLGLITTAQIGLVVVASTAGALVESLLAANFEERGYLTNDLLNFLNTAAAAAIAVALSR
jgi:uncharacterized protein (TIGR00297 family)